MRQNGALCVDKVRELSDAKALCGMKMRIRHSRHGGRELEHWRVRRELLALFRRVAERHHLSPLRLAWMCGTSEPRAWVLLYGPIEQINSETLIDVLARLGVTVDIVVRSDVPWYVTERAERMRRDREASIAKLAAMRRRPRGKTSDHEAIIPQNGANRTTTGPP